MLQGAGPDKKIKVVMTFGTWHSWMTRIAAVSMGAACHYVISENPK
jgi:hypothetical protein